MGAMRPLIIIIVPVVNKVVVTDVKIERISILECRL